MSGDKEDSQIEQLVDELASDPGYASGERKFPRRIGPAEVSTIAGSLQHEVDRGVAARAESAVAQGMTIACKVGCNGCCKEPIMVYRPEAIRVARWLDRPENAEARAAFRAAYPAWRDQAGDLPAKLSAKFVNDPANYLDAHVDAWRKGILCAFNRDGACTIYPVRPITCRTAHALETAEYCTGSSTKPASRASFVPLEQFVARTRKLLAAAHHAVRGPKGRVEALCNVVYELLPPTPRAQ